ncbi:hypothetical protein C1H46_025142 [Malus baccata]|uniref:Hemimethylated DNA-binding domain-containing protein n=1 Tax=Malus baccata TaxID=106549 RepID=A0A540LS07_MALBA|nr:hypothetical protein C1H46_025142 [Malus baccata]
MVQGLSLSTLTAFCYGGLCGSMPSWRKQFKLMSKTPDKFWCRKVWYLAFGPSKLICKRLHRCGETKECEGGSWLDLATRVQYALNTEQYDVAQQLRNKLTEVEAEVIRQQEAKRGSSPKSEAQDKAISYRAVVCGMDPVCSESSSWMETAQVEKLTRGSNQPFYQILVDVHADPNLLVAYASLSAVSEENLLAPEEPDVDRFDHPYISFLFYGMDAAGDFIPIRQLREKCNRPRHEIPYDPLDEGQGSDA